jgi:hypothetical protein
VHYSYPPFDPDKADRWATGDARNAWLTCGAIAVPSVILSVWMAAQWAQGDAWYNAAGKVILAVLCGVVFPFVYPFRWPWRSPWRAYQDTYDLCWQKYEEYHEAAIERMRTPRPSPAEKVVTVERPIIDPLDMLYRQCGVALVRAQMSRASNPRTAQEKVITDVDGVTVTLDKTNYRTVAAALCELGFFKGGEGKAYELADEWKDQTAGELLAALRARKARLRLKDGMNG